MSILFFGIKKKCLKDFFFNDLRNKRIEKNIYLE